MRDGGEEGWRLEGWRSRGIEPQCQKEEKVDFQQNRKQEWDITAQHRCLCAGNSIWDGSSVPRQ